jgi:hypothetical protein
MQYQRLGTIKFQSRLGLVKADTIIECNLFSPWFFHWSDYPFWYYNSPPSWYYNSPPCCQITPSGTTTVLPVVRLPLLVLQQSSLLSGYPFWYYNSPPSCQSTPSAMALQEGDKFFLIMKKRGGFSWAGQFNSTSVLYFLSASEFWLGSKRGKLWRVTL